MNERLSSFEQNHLARSVIKDIKLTGDSKDWGFLLQRRQELSILLGEKRLEGEGLMIFLSLTVGLHDAFGKHYNKVVALWERRHLSP